MEKPWTLIATALFDLLDDIDTLDDELREEDDAVFRQRALAIAEKRFQYGETDGYNLRFHLPSKPDA